MPKYRKFTQEYRDEAVLMVIQSGAALLEGPQAALGMAPSR
jgi:hypothetical protein